MTLLIYVAFTAASILSLIAFSVRLVIGASTVRSCMVMAPVCGLAGYLLMDAAGYQGLALSALALATAVVFVGGIFYAITDIPLDEYLFPPKESSTETELSVAPSPPPPNLEPTRHAHLRVVSSSRSVS